MTVGVSWAFPGDCSDYRAGLSDFCCAYSLASAYAFELDLLWNGRVYLWVEAVNVWPNGFAYFFAYFIN